MRWLRTVQFFVLASAAVSFATACGPKKYNKRPRPRPDYDERSSESSEEPSKPKEKMRQGTAGPNEWLGIPGFGARVRVPQGWSWGQQGVAVIANSPKSSGSIVFVGAENDAAMDERLSKAFEVLKITRGAPDTEPKQIELNGGTYVRQDYSKAMVEGQPAHAIAIAGRAPTKAGGYVLLVGYALLGSEDSEEELRDCANSISK
jgi:hypothetical protein